MSSPEEIIAKWLSQAPDGAPPQLEGKPLPGGGNPHAGEEPSGESQEVIDQEVIDQEEIDLWNRLRVVRGLLGTLDARVAPQELDRRVEGMLQEGIAEIPDGLPLEIQEVESATSDQNPPIWSELLGELKGAGDEDLLRALESGKPASELSDLQAPEFLDRIVEGRLQAIEDQLGEVRTRQKRMRWVRRGSLALSVALVLMLVPWQHLGQDKPSDPADGLWNGGNIPLVQHSSLDSLRSAYPEQARFAAESGEFGVLVNVSKAKGSNGPAVDPNGAKKPGGLR